MIEFQVELQDIDARFAKKTELAVFCVACNYRVESVWRHAALRGDAGELKVSGCWSDVGVKTRGGGGDEVNRNGRAGSVGLRRCSVGGDALDELLIGGGVVGAAGVCRVVARAGRGGPRVEIGGR